MLIFFPANGIIKNERVAQAMKAVDRGNFCSHAPYMDAPQGIGYAVTISAPHMVRFSFGTVSVTREPLRDVEVILQWYSSNPFYEFISVCKIGLR